MTCAKSVLPTFMHYPRLFKPESIANVQIEIQIVDTHETLVVIGLPALGHHLNRTLLLFHQDKALNLTALNRLESIVFSAATSDAKKMSARFDGVEQLAKLVSSLRGK